MSIRSSTARRLHGFAQSVSARNRDRKWQLFNQVFPDTDDWAIIDVGFAPGGQQATDNYFEKRYPDLTRVTALTIAEIGDAPDRYPGLTIRRYEGKVIPFDADSFDVVWSNAVLEHVGDRASQVAFLRELDRVAQRHFVTTPNRWFPIEVHTQFPLVHYLPQRAFEWIVVKLGKSWAANGYMNLLSRRQLKSALDEAGVSGYRIVPNRLLGLPLDYVVIW